MRNYAFQVVEQALWVVTSNNVQCSMEDLSARGESV